ncbi:MAG: N-acetyltransferase [bacterium]|nr:N-acetyltransferase [bacterium]MDE0418540.1 N-acetyltransferase [bacterium]
MVEIIEERPRDRLAVETIARMSLGQRLVDSPAARLRQGSRKIAELSLVALEGGHVVATIRCWPVLIGAGTRAIQLGPVAVDPDHRGRGISRVLITTTLERARTLGHRIVVLIGDGDIYARYGFEPALPRDITLAETRDRERLHVLALVPNALAGLSGAVRPDTIPAL